MHFSHFEACRRRCNGRARGFTLIELMVTLTIAGVLLGLGVPTFSKLIANNRITTQTNEFVGALNMARSEAVRRAQGVSLRSSNGGIDYSRGWQIYTDPNLAGGTPTAAEVIRESSGLPGKTTFKLVAQSGTAPNFTYADASTGKAVVFNSRGGNNGGAQSFFRVCDSSDSSIKGRILQVSTIGKIVLFNATATCP